jgi:hypothetical protein
VSISEHKLPHDNSPEDAVDKSLGHLSIHDFPQLHQAVAKLILKSKDKQIDVFFHSRITAMLGTLNL